MRYISRNKTKVTWDSQISYHEGPEHIDYQEELSIMNQKKKHAIKIRRKSKCEVRGKRPYNFY